MAKYVLEAVENGASVTYKVYPEFEGPVKGKTKYFTNEKEAMDCLLQKNAQNDTVVEEPKVEEKPAKKTRKKKDDA